MWTAEWKVKFRRQRQQAGPGSVQLQAGRDIHVHGNIVSGHSLSSRLDESGDNQIWHAPLRNPRFHGREDALRTIAERLHASDDLNVCTLTGLGGVGKSQLAVEYAYLYADQYSVVWFMDAENVPLIEEQYLELATALGVEISTTNPASTRQALSSALTAIGDFLLIFDNMDGAELATEWLPSLRPDKTSNRHVLITTRRAGFEALGATIEIELPALTEACNFLRAQTPMGRSEAEAIAVALDRLPLALEQAVGYITLTKVSPSDYLRLFRARKSEMLAQGTVAGREVTLATLWDLSLHALSHEAIELIGYCAYLAGSSIPLGLFSRNYDIFESPISEVARDELLLDEAVSSIASHSLASNVAGRIQVHGLVQAAIRRHHEISAGGGRTPLGSTIARPPDRLQFVLELLRLDGPEQVHGHPENWPRWAELLPHVIAATDLYADSHHFDLDTIVTCSHLLDKVGSYLQEQGRWEAARVIFRRALHLIDDVLDPMHPSIARALNNLALFLKTAGEPDEALPLAKRALAITKATRNANDPLVAVDLNNVAMILDDLGRYDAARVMAEEALAITRSALGESDRATATRLNNLASVLNHSGDHEGALALLEQSLTIVLGSLGSTHTSTALVYESIGNVTFELGFLSRSYASMLRALEIFRIHFGEDHPSVERVRTKVNAIAAAMTAT